MVPQILKSLPNWLWWKLENVNGRDTKVPYVAGSWTRHASSTDPSTWSTVEVVADGSTADATHGVGFVLGGQAVQQKIVGFDLDGCRNKETGEVTEWAKQIVALLNSYTEITPSEMGLRVWVQGELPDGARRFALNPSCGFGDKVGIEVYDSGRYFTVSGKAYHSSFVDMQSLDLTQAYKLCHEIRTKYPAAKMQGTSHDGDSKVVFTQVGRLLTTKLSVLMYGQITSRSPFTVTDEYGSNVQSPSQSEADLSLCTLLASQGLDADQIEDQFRASALMRKKWERQDYSTGTIQKALKTAEQKGKQAADQQTQTVPEDESTTTPFRIIGAELEPKGDVLLVFPTEDDALLARSLGFNAVAVLDGEGTRAHLAMIKVKYEHVAIFSDGQPSCLLHGQINPGSIFVEFPQDYTKPKQAKRRTYPKYTSLTEAKASGQYDDYDLQGYLKSIVEMQAVKSTRILHSPVEMRTKIQSVLEQAKTNLEKYEPKVVVSVTMEDLRKLQFLDGSFPKGLTKTSLWGLLGDFVNIAHPTTAACKEMILYELMPMIGVMLGSAYYLPYGSDKHFPSLFTLAIGRTTDGKGQAMNHVKRMMEEIDPAWTGENLHSDPASGEGLVRMLAARGLRHGAMRNRVAIFNSEMSTMFNAQARENSTLSGHLRKAYDGVDIENFRSDKSKTFRASGYLLGMCGMITPMELRKVMPYVDWTNGAANRFLWSIGFADKELAYSTKRPDFSGWVTRAKAILDMNVLPEPVAIDYSPEGKTVWQDWFHSLPKHNDDILSESQQRAPANCARVANLYAQLDERRLDGWKVTLEPQHVLAAAEIVSRSRQSVEWYLGQQVLTPDNSYDEVMKLKSKMLSKARETGVLELTSSEVCKLFTHKTAEQRDELCLKAGFKMTSRKPEGGGKTATVWTT